MGQLINNLFRVNTACPCNKKPADCAASASGSGLMAGESASPSAVDSTNSTAGTEDMVVAPESASNSTASAENVPPETADSGAAVGAETEWATPESVANHLVDTMNDATSAEFASIAADVRFQPGHYQIAASTIRAHTDQLMTNEGRAKWQVPQRYQFPKQAGGKEERCSTPKEKLVLSEDKKDLLRVLAAAAVSDMFHGLRCMVANDDRILRLSMNNSPRFKERIIKDYKATLIAKRKNEVGLLRAASKLAEANVSTKALRAIRSILNDMGFRYVLPTEEDLKDAANRIDKCVADDLVVTPTEDGWFASPTATLESELLRRLQMAAAANTKDLSGGRVIGKSGPGCMGWQAEATCKITMDARTVTQKQSQTETTMQIFKPGAEGSAESHKALSLRTLGI